MAVELLQHAPAFANQMRLCDAAFAEFVDWSLLETVRSGSAPDRVDVVQPVLFAVMVSLAAQWRALGIHPDAVLGHSQGEIAAAYVAGVLSLRDAAKVITLRSKAVSTIAGTGGMVSIACSPERVHKLIEPWAQSIAIAALNGPRSTVVTGDAASLDELMIACGHDGVPPVAFPSTTLRIPRTLMTCGSRCARTFPGCGPDAATSPSFRQSPVPDSTPTSSTATTGSPICGNRCCSSRRSDGRVNKATARSSSRVRTRY